MNTEEFLEHQKRIMIDAINETTSKSATEGLRDYFAAAAMQALITGPERKDDHYEEEQNEATVVRAYIIADAMLKERERGE